MSDAFTDAARDSQRGRAISELLDAIYKLLSGLSPASLEPDPAQMAKIIKSAEKADSIRGGWSGRTKFADGIEQFVKNLIGQDKKTWLQVLSMIFPNDWDWDYGEGDRYRQFKALSPFRDKILVFGQNDGKKIYPLKTDIVDLMPDFKGSFVAEIPEHGLIIEFFEEKEPVPTS